MARNRYKITEPTSPHFLTCSIVNWLPVFTRPQAVQEILNSWNWLKQNDELQLYGFVIMENHLHFIASSPVNLGNAIHRFKSFTARQIIDLLQRKNEKTLLGLLADGKLAHKKDREYQLWQEGCHPVLIQSETMMRQRLDYMHQNPVRRGYVREAGHWLPSSAGYYLGGEAVGVGISEW